MRWRIAFWAPFLASRLTPKTRPGTWTGTAVKADLTEAKNNLAWLLATLPPAKEAPRLGRWSLRNGRCELTDNRVPGNLDTLAVAYPLHRRFDDALPRHRRPLILARLYRPTEIGRGDRGSAATVSAADVLTMSRLAQFLGRISDGRCQRLTSQVSFGPSREPPSPLILFRRAPVNAD